MKKNMKVLFLLILIGAATGTTQAALLNGDPAAYISGITSFNGNIGGTIIAVNVEYAVYSAGTYTGYIPPTLPAGKNIYAYQLFNTTNSKISVNFFSVGLNPGAIQANDQCWDDSGYGTPGGIARASTEFTGFIASPPQEAGYSFFSNSIAKNQHSIVLLFSSNFGPTDGYGTIGGALAVLPTPVPEPTTMVLLGSLVPFVLRKFRTKS